MALPRTLPRRLRLASLLVLALGAVSAGEEAPAQTRSADAAGRYGIWRGDKDTGCMLTLENRVASHGLKAQLSPACRDNGLVIFDPQGWSVDRNRLTLTARQGHKNHFDRLPGGGWRRDVKEGKDLTLRPL